MNQQHYRIKAGITGRRLLVLIMLMMSTTTYAATSYLQELEAEAAATEEAADSNESASPKWSEQTPAGNGESIVSGLSKPQFEETLKARYYGSYLFYSTLTEAKQKVVYEEYKKDNNIKHLRQVIQSQMTN